MAIATENQERLDFWITHQSKSMPVPSKENATRDMLNVSVIIPAFNEASRIGRAIQSVRNQTHKVKEILVIDDGSADETQKVGSSFADPVIYIRQDNLGPAAARNTGIKNAKYEWIAFLDADDEWTPDHIENAWRIIQRHPDLVWYCAAIEERDEDGYSLGKIDADESSRRGDIIEDYFKAEAKTHFSFTICMLIKKRVFDEVGGFNEEIRQSGEDLDMWFRIALRYPSVGYANSLGAFYRRRKGSITNVSEPDIARFLRRIEITRSSTGKMPGSIVKGSEVLIRSWVISAIKETIRQEDTYSLGEIRKAYGRLLPKKWQLAVQVFRSRAAMRLAKLASMKRNQWWKRRA